MVVSPCRNPSPCAIFILLTDKKVSLLTNDPREQSAYAAVSDAERVLRPQQRMPADPPQILEPTRLLPLASRVGPTAGSNANPPRGYFEVTGLGPASDNQPGQAFGRVSGVQISFVRRKILVYMAVRIGLWVSLGAVRIRLWEPSGDSPGQVNRSDSAATGRLGTAREIPSSRASHAIPSPLAMRRQKCRPPMNTCSTAGECDRQLRQGRAAHPGPH